MTTDARLQKALIHPRLSPNASLHLLGAASRVVDYVCPGVHVEWLDACATDEIEYMVRCANQHTISAHLHVGRFNYFLRAECYNGQSLCEIDLSKGRVSAHDLLDLARILNDLAHLGRQIEGSMSYQWAELQSRRIALFDS